MLPPASRRLGGKSALLSETSKTHRASRRLREAHEESFDFPANQLDEPDFDEPESELEVDAGAGLLSETLLSADLPSPDGTVFPESAPDFDSAPDSEDGALFDA